MDRERSDELEGQSSINELLDEPVGINHVQMVLPLHIQLPMGEFRRL
jgi:hypothetical protein